MAKLILELDETILNELPLAGESVTIGRDKNNTIPINHMAISRFHARFDPVGSDYSITDLQSTNGTFVNDEYTANRRLFHGDRILIGRHLLTFLDPENKDKKKFEDTREYLSDTQELSYDEQLQVLSDNRETSQKAKENHEIGTINFIDSSGLGEIELREKHTRIGKDFLSDIRLQGLFIGRTAAIISRKPAGYIITFVGGISNLKVNGQVVKSSKPLNDFDVIKIGPYIFQFYYIQ
ncbi:FHA domain-containing protein [Thermodesulfobacteriota bacterium]